MRLFTAAIATALLALAGAAEANACSCVGPKPGQGVDDFIRETARKTDGALTVKVVGLKPPASEDDFAPATFTFRVLRAYNHRQRYERGERIRIRAPIDSGANCGLPDAKGYRTGVFLDRYRGRLTTSSCLLIPPELLRQAMTRKDSNGGRAALARACARAGRAASV